MKRTRSGSMLPGTQSRFSSFLFAKEANREQIEGQLVLLMTIAALLAGFGAGVAFSVGPEEINAYATWEQEYFFGRNSIVCVTKADRWRTGAMGELIFSSAECNADECWSGCEEEYDVK